VKSEKAGLARIWKIIWIFLCVVVYLISMIFFDKWPNGEASIFLAITMFVLTFPLGLILFLLVNCVAYVLYTKFGISAPENYFALTVTWIVFVVVGYFQWFVLIPYLKRRFFSKSKKKTEAVWCKNSDGTF